MLNLEIAVAEVDEPSFTIHLERDPDFGSIDLVVLNDEGDEFVLGFIDEAGVLQLEQQDVEAVDALALSGLAFDDSGYLQVVA